jgi:hypothetical protein
MAVRFGRLLVGALVLAVLGGVLALAGAAPAGAAVGPCVRAHVTVPGTGHDGVRELRLSRDGRWLLYERSGMTYDLVLHDRLGEQDDVVIADIVAQTGDLSADGSTVVYVQDVEGADQMFVYDVAEDDSDQVTSFGGGTVLDRGMETSVDGEVTVTVSPSELDGVGPGTEQVFAITREGVVTQVSATAPDDYAGNAVISDDGEVIAWSTNTTDGSIPQIVATEEGEGIWEVTDFAGGNVLSNVDLSISGDGDTLAFFTEGNGLPATNPEGNAEVYAIAVHDGVLTPITQTADARSGGPTLDFLGELTAFHQEPDEGNRGVLVGDERDDTISRATPTSGQADWPSIAGDGAWIAFAADATLSGEGETSDPWVATCGLYTDVGPGNQFLGAIAWLRSHEITTGYVDGSFRPSAAVSRQAMSAFLYRLAGSPSFTPPDTAELSDVGTSHPFFAEISWLVDQEIASGYSDDTFRPAAAVTRQAMSAFLYRFAGAEESLPTEAPFDDVSVNHPFAREIAWMAESEISTGYADGTFKPAANVTRQAMAAFLVRTDTWIRANIP